MIELIIGAVVVFGICLTATIWVVRSGGRARRLRRPWLDQERIDLTEESETPQAPKETLPNDDSTALERSKLVVHALLQSLLESIESLVDGSAKYDNSLERHRAGIKKAMTIAGIRELERVMLTELGEMQSANSQYRHQLDKANTKLVTQKRELERLQSDVGIDFLTKVANRRAFDARLAEEIDRAKRYGGTFSLVLLDLDNFKRVNDFHGHLAGDRVLRGIAHILDEHRRTSDMLARYGGEEFVLILPETSADQARLLAEKTREKVKRSKFRYEKSAISVTLSAGVGEIILESDTAKTLLTRVDGALYRAKERGRNCVAVAEPPAQAD